MHKVSGGTQLGRGYLKYLGAGGGENKTQNKIETKMLNSVAYCSDFLQQIATYFG